MWRVCKQKRNISIAFFKCDSGQIGIAAIGALPAVPPEYWCHLSLCRFLVFSHGVFGIISHNLFSTAWIFGRKCCTVTFKLLRVEYWSPFYFIIELLTLHYKKVAGSIPNKVIDIFRSVNPSGRTVTLGFYSASNRNEYQQCLLGGLGSLCVGLTTLPLSCAECLQILGTSTSWRPKGLSRPVIGRLI